MLCKRRIEIREAGKPHPLRKDRSPDRIIWDRMGLQAVFHLQNVFQLSQKRICLGELRQFKVRDQMPVTKPVERDQRVRRTYPFIDAAVGKL
jgi:hypothetical protein